MSEIKKSQGGPLSSEEQVELVRCERIIRDNLQTFWDVGEALLCVRENRLYIETHRSFEAWCQEKWDIPRKSADRHIAAFKVKSNVPILNEAQAREMIGMNPEEQKEAWEMAEGIGGGDRVTARDLHEAADIIRKGLGEPDKYGIPSDELYLTMKASLTQCLMLFKRFENLENPWLNKAFVSNWLKNVRTAISDAKPERVCPKCKGSDANCQLCKGMGWLCKLMSDSAKRTHG